MAARHEGDGEPPTPEELLAYRDGRLDAAARQVIEDKLALHPDEARALADLQAFPDVEPAPGTPDLSDEEIAARWQSFRRRLEDRPAGPGGGSAGPPASSPATAPRKVRRWPGLLRLVAAAAIGLGVGWAAGFGWGPSLPGSPTIVQAVELLPRGAGALRSTAPPVELAYGAEELLLVLSPPGSAEWDGAEFEAEILDQAGHQVWSRRGLRPAALGTFQLSFRRAALTPGRYRIDLFRRDGDARARWASYDLRLLAAPEPP